MATQVGFAPAAPWSLLQGTCRLAGMEAGYAGLTDPGRVRANNEDGLLLVPEAGLFAVADGLGGLGAGDVASRTALGYLHRQLSALPFQAGGREPSLSGLEALIAAANYHTYEHRLDLGNTMATTLALIWAGARSVLAAHVGDSRVYRWHRDRLIRITSDHSLVHALYEQGALTEAQARQSPQRHVITRAIGAEAVVQPSIRAVEVDSGDVLLLCTDGLTAMVPDEAIAALLGSGPSDPGALVDGLVRMANEAGGHDNITAIAVTIAP
ncbi:MAG: protein phosphatase 2C domain-containing protein [Desulfobulbus sp.]|uniref:PP2C family protein-serine/threonine phosphatase n=1 Tax=Desulfobulbus sp. TaxID=895 RepID=UPI0028428BAA|nr:protein phosphatase 2C domain-containing protein [Desulfobulbus sp.]MDR2551299.1 protein phosphatase 2C domain-containing protein [Desulfobulbus sp.]